MGHVSSERLPTFMTAEQRKKEEGPKLEDEAPDDGDAPPSDVRRATSAGPTTVRGGATVSCLPGSDGPAARLRKRQHDLKCEPIQARASSSHSCP